jgi:hypothetical protein
MLFLLALAIELDYNQRRSLSKVRFFATLPILYPTFGCMIFAHADAIL